MKKKKGFSFVQAEKDRYNSEYSRGNEDEALAHYEKAISLDPTDSSGYEMRGNYYYYRLRKHEQGIVDYIKLYQMFPSLRYYYGDRLIKMCKDAGLYEVGEGNLCCGVK